MSLKIYKDKRHSKKRDLSYRTDGRLQMALEEFLENQECGRISVYSLSKKYGIPRSTLRWRLKLSNPLQLKKPGTAPSLNVEEETVLVNWLFQMAKCGYPCTRARLLNEVQSILNKQGRIVFKNNNRPSKRWIHNFIHRHPALTVRQETDYSETNFNKQLVLNWFNGLKLHLKDDGWDNRILLDKGYANQIFSCTQIIFEIKDNFLPEYAVSNSYSACSGDIITVLVCLNAAGTFLKPFIVESDANPCLKCSDIHAGSFDIAYSLNGSLTRTAFCKWFDIFIEQINELNIEKPVLLLLDNDKVYFDITTFQEAKQGNITLHCFPSSYLCILKPLSRVFYPAIKEAYKDSLDYFSSQYGLNIDKEHFINVFMCAWRRVSKFDDAVTAFELCGIVPFDTKVLDWDEIERQEVKCEGRLKKLTNPKKVVQTITLQPSTVSFENPNEDVIAGINETISLIFNEFVPDELKSVHMKMFTETTYIDENMYDPVFKICSYLKEKLQEAEKNMKHSEDMAMDPLSCDN